jgi:hypothetical protein
MRVMWIYQNVRVARITDVFCFAYTFDFTPTLRHSSHTHRDIHTHTHTNTHTQTLTHTHSLTHTHTHTHTETNTLMHTVFHTQCYTHTHRQCYTHIHTHIHVHTHTHTHMHNPPPHTPTQVMVWRCAMFIIPVEECVLLLWTGSSHANAQCQRIRPCPVRQLVELREIRIRIYLPFWPNKVMRPLYCWEWQQSNSSVCFSLSLTHGHKDMLFDTQVCFKVPPVYTPCTTLY